MVDSAEVMSRVVEAVRPFRSTVTSESYTMGDGRMIWISSADEPSIGILTVDSADDVQVLCADYTFEAVSVDLVAELLTAILGHRAKLISRGRLVKRLMLVVPMESGALTATRNYSRELEEWEQRLSDP